MRILQVHNRHRSNSPGGEDRVVDQEAAALVVRGHVVERFERANDDIDHWSSGRKALLPARVLWANDARRELAKTIRQARPDVVHVHNTFPLISPSVLLACRTAEVPAVVTVHNYRMICPSGELFREESVCRDCVGRFPLPAIRHGCYHGSHLESLPAAAALVAHRRVWRTIPSAYVFISNAQRRQFMSLRLPESRVFVKTNLIPATELGPVTPRQIVLYAGRLTPSKGINVLLTAWDRYTAANPMGRLGLVIAGSGPLAERVAAWASSRTSVEVTGLLSRRECATLTASARAVIVPSTWEEGFGLIAVEAMAAGVPPVASARGAFPELIEHRVDGVLFDAGDAQRLAQIFAEIDEFPERYASYGRAARRTYERRFDPNTNVEQLLDIYAFALEHPVLKSQARREISGSEPWAPSEKSDEEIGARSCGPASDTKHSASTRS
jgi:glycosyltransferase involved in cell wall biosynthesis